MKEHSLFYTIGLVTVTALTMVACGKKIMIMKIVQKKLVNFPKKCL